MAANWNVRAVYPDGGIVDVNFFGKDAADRTAESARAHGAEATVSPLDCPPVPTEAECEGEREQAKMLREYADEEQSYYWMDRPDDYNVFEEQQVFLDNEGGEY